MAYQTLSLGLTLTIPTPGTKNWGSTLYNTTWTKISQHKHTGTGDGNQLSTGSFADNSVTGAKLAKNIYHAQHSTILTPAGTTQTVDFNNGNIQKLNLGSATGDVTLTLSNSAQGAVYKLYIAQGATARNIVWPAEVKWPQGQAAILSVDNGSVDCVTLYFDGTNYFGTWEVDYR